MNAKNTEKHGEKPEKEALRIVEPDEAGGRLDRFLRRRFPGVGQGQIEKWLRTGQIRVDGKRADSSDRLAAGAKVRLPPQLLRDPSFARNPSLSGPKPVRNPENLKKWVLFEDKDVVVLNKPAGLAVQGGTGLKENLDDSLMAFSLDGKTRPKLVHRLDRETSGVLLIARSDFAAARLAASFRARDTQKIYWAVTVGVPRRDRGLIEIPLIKSGQIVRAAEEGDEAGAAKSAATLYKVVSRVRGKAAFVALRPLTGRTHQLRVHLALLGAPILGDPLYGGKGPEEAALPLAELGKGLHLHARRLIIPHPRRGLIDVTAPLGPERRKTWSWFGFDERAEVSFEEET